MAENEDLPDHFKRLGAAHARLLIETRTLQPQFHPAAIRWLAGQDQERRSTEEDFRRRSLGHARRAEIAAIIAAIAAVASIIISAIQRIVSVLTSPRK